MSYVYGSVFSDEIYRYLDLLRAAGRYIYQIQSTLRSFDKFLVGNELSRKIIESETVSAWIKSRNVSMRTKASKIGDVKGFSKYLISLGIEASLPEIPKVPDNYVPYIFSDSEMERIIMVADNIEAGKAVTRSAMIFPILLRVLYGCGLRLGEGRSLRWRDVDLENGVLFIPEAKNRKQRFVPMDSSLNDLLILYREMTRFDGICDDYLFESNFNPGEPFRNNSFYEWFMKALDAAGVHYAKQHRRERGPCPHCLRHYFTLKSFLKSDNEGRRFEDTSPFLAAYLGHDSIKELEAYLRSNHSVYIHSHQRVDAAIGHLFPEVDFDED
jgi:integrase